MHLTTRFGRHALSLCSLLVFKAVYGQSPAPEALNETMDLATEFGVPINQIPAAAGNYTLTSSQSFTAAALPGATIQSNAPQLGVVPTYPWFQQDGYQSPYVSNNLRNFRFSYFNNVFNFGGGNTFSSEDYASVHGFNVVAAGYQRNGTTVTWMPAGTQWMYSSGYPDWGSFMATLGLDAGRWDEVVDLGEERIIQAMNDARYYYNLDPAVTDQLMIDMEHVALDPATLRQQAWYPSGANAADKAAFEKKYYDGFALTEYAPVDAARRLGFNNISLYGWSPANAGWYTLPTYPADPNTNWYWQNVGIQVISHVDSVNNSVYCYYWTKENTAYTLAQNDLNLAYVKSLPTARQKPVRPYFWNQLHGGGGGWRWWAQQGLATEEMRAIALLNAFTQYDGMVLWNYSGNNNDNLPPGLAVNTDVMVADNSFVATQEGGGARTFSRYDALHITNVDGNNNVQFQLIDKNGWGTNMGVGPGFPFYDTTANDITPHLRAPDEPLAAMFEGLAMAKLLEWNLRNDTKVVDFDAQQTFAQGLPILRHLQNGNLHIIATYDPQVVYGQPAREITVNTFGGIAGLTVTFAADDQVRIYVVQLPTSGG